MKAIQTERRENKQSANKTWSLRDQTDIAQPGFTSKKSAIKNRIRLKTSGDNVNEGPSSPYQAVPRISKSTIDIDGVKEVVSDDGTVQSLTVAERLERTKRKRLEKKVLKEKELQEKINAKIAKLEELQDSRCQNAAKTKAKRKPEDLKVEAEKLLDEVLHDTPEHVALRKLLFKSIVEGDEEMACTVISNPHFHIENHEDQRECTLLHAVSERGMNSAAKTILDMQNFHRAGATDFMGWNAFHRAARCGSAEICQTILSHKSIRSKVVNARGPQGYNALHCAAIYGHVDVMKLLLEDSKFAMNDGVDASGRTALHCAAFHGHTGAVSLLLDHPRFNGQAARDACGQSAVHYALNQRHLEVAKILLQYPGGKDSLSGFRDLMGEEASDADEILGVAADEGLPVDWVPVRGAVFAELRFHEIRTSQAPTGEGHGPVRSRQAVEAEKPGRRISRRAPKVHGDNAVLLTKADVLNGKRLLTPGSSVLVTRSGVVACSRIPFQKKLNYLAGNSIP